MALLNFEASGLFRNGSVALKVLRQLRQVLLEGHRVNRILESKGRHADDEVHGDVVQVGQFIQEGGLQFDGGVAVAVQLDLIAGNPAHAFLQVE